MKITAAEKKRRDIRRRQHAASSADAAYSKKGGYNTRPKPSMPKMPWDDEPATGTQRGAISTGGTICSTMLRGSGDDL